MISCSYPPRHAGNEYHYATAPTIHTASIKSLQDSVKIISFTKTIKFNNKLAAKVFLCPNTIRGGGGGGGGDESGGREMELRLEIVTKGDLLTGILGKTKICFIQVVTQVTERDTNLILAKYSDNHFTISDWGIANCVCKLIGSEELKNCNTQSVDISIEAILSVRDWHDFNMVDMDDGFVEINHS